MNRRHHCRMCGESVCRSCSPNMLQLGGDLQRFCTPCVLSGAGALDLLPRLQNLRELIHRCAYSAEANPALPAVSFPLPAQALAECEEAISHLAAKQYKTEGTGSSMGFKPWALGSLGSRGIVSTSSLGPGNSLVVGQSINSLSKAAGFLPIKPCLPAVQPFAEWEVNTPNCSICEARLGKRRLRRRHHCRVCGKCICSKCSPNFIALPNLKGTHRACKLCVGIVHMPVGEGRGPRPWTWLVSRGTVTHQV